MRYCPQCDRAEDGPYAYCSECGTRLAATDDASAAPESVAERDGLRFAMTYPARSGARHVAVGALLAVLSVTVLPAVYLCGYYAAVAERAAAGADPPSFRPVSGHFERGVEVLAGLVPAAALVAAVGWALVSVIGTAGLAVAALLAYPVPAVVATHAVEGEWRAVARPRRLLSFVASGEYLAGVGLTAVVLVVCTSVGLTAAVTVLAPVVALFYAGAATAALWGWVYQSHFRLAPAA